jgi:hypothetical protein
MARASGCLQGGWTALLKAAQNGEVECLAALLERRPALDQASHVRRGGARGTQQGPAKGVSNLQEAFLTGLDISPLCARAVPADGCHPAAQGGAVRAAGGPSGAAGRGGSRGPGRQCAGGEGAGLCLCRHLSLMLLVFFSFVAF